MSGSSNARSSIAERIEALWRDRIPLASHLGVRISHLEPGFVELAAPLGPNSNHMGTGFAGSLLAVGSLAGWAAVASLLGDPGHADIVVQASKARFRLPVETDFVARCRVSEQEIVQQFLDTYARRGRARLSLETRIISGDSTAMTLTGRFVAIQRKADSERR